MLRDDGVEVALQLVLTPPVTFQVIPPAKAGLLLPPESVAVKVIGVPTVVVIAGSALKERVAGRAARLIDKSDELAP